MGSNVNIFFCLVFLCGFQEIFAIRDIDESTFKSDFCDVKCRGKTHTMCPTRACNCSYSDYKLYSFYDGNKVTQLLKRLVQGHNGVRDRIAEKLRMRSMIEVMWDIKLQKMAENFLRCCSDEDYDPCAQEVALMSAEDTFDEFYKFNRSHAYIVQNTYTFEEPFLPKTFFAQAIRSWYFDREFLKVPQKTPRYGEFAAGMIFGENNFTHMVYPFVYKFGCGLARFNKKVRLICNYYPYYRTYTNAMVYAIGKPTTDCPAFFPLKDSIYRSLCTDIGIDEFKNSSSKAVQSDYTVDLIICVLVKETYNLVNTLHF